MKNLYVNCLADNKKTKTIVKILMVILIKKLFYTQIKTIPIALFA